MCRHLLRREAWKRQPPVQALSLKPARKRDCWCVLTTLLATVSCKSLQAMVYAAAAHCMKRLACSDLLAVASEECIGLIAGRGGEVADYSGGHAYEG